MLPDVVAKRFERISELLHRCGRDPSTAARLAEDRTLWAAVEDWPICVEHLVVDARLSELVQLMDTVAAELPHGEDRDWVQELSNVMRIARQSVEPLGDGYRHPIGDDEAYVAERWYNEDGNSFLPRPGTKITGKWPPE